MNNIKYDLVYFIGRPGIKGPRLLSYVWVINNSLSR